MRNCLQHASSINCIKLADFVNLGHIDESTHTVLALKVIVCITLIYCYKVLINEGIQWVTIMPGRVQQCDTRVIEMSECIEFAQDKEN